MGTGSVTDWFSREFRFADGACPLFRTANTEHRGKRGQAPRGYGSSRTCGRYLLGASPRFPLTAYRMRTVRRGRTLHARVWHGAVEALAFGQQVEVQAEYVFNQGEDFFAVGKLPRVGNSQILFAGRACLDPAGVVAGDRQPDQLAFIARAERAGQPVGRPIAAAQRAVQQPATILASQGGQRRRRAAEGAPGPVDRFGHWRIGYRRLARRVDHKRRGQQPAPEEQQPGRARLVARPPNVAGRSLRVQTLLREPGNRPDPGRRAWPGSHDPAHPPHGPAGRGR